MSILPQEDHDIYKTGSEAHILSDRERKNIAILETIRRHGPTTKADISKLTKINIVTVYNYINTYVQSGLVVESGLATSTGGRRPGVVELNPQAGFTIGVDLGLWNVTGVLTDLKANIVQRVVKERPGKDGERVVSSVIDTIKELLAQAKHKPSELKNINIGVSGLVDKEAGTIRCTKGVVSIYMPITRMVEEAFGVQTFLEHDATAAAFGEWWLNFGTDTRIVLYLCCGVGCGIVINGEVYQGVSGVAGEISIKETEEEGQLGPWVGNISSLRPWAMDLGMVPQARNAMTKGVNSEIFRRAENNPERISLAMILQAAREGDKLAVELVTAAGAQLGVRVAFLVNLFNPEVVVIGGGLEQAGEIVLDAVKSAVRTYAFEEAANAVKIVPSRFRENAVSLGAAALGIREIFARA